MAPPRRVLFEAIGAATDTKYSFRLDQVWRAGTGLMGAKRAAEYADPLLAVNR